MHTPSHRKSLAYTKFLVGALLIFFCYLYFAAVGPIGQFHDTFLWSRPANIHDHYIYLDWARRLPISSMVAGDNNFGISWIFLTLVDTSNEFHIFLLNCVFLLIAYICYCKICDRFCLSARYYWLFFLNSFFLYFSLLINKDMATCAIVLAAAWLALQRKFLLLVLLVPVAFVIRQQLAMFVCLTIFLESPVFRYRWRAIVTFAVGSLIGIYLLKTMNFIDEATLGEGITGQLQDFLINHEWLAPIGVPLRIALYIFSYFASIYPITLGYIDAIKALRIPSIVFFIFMAPKVIHAMRYRNLYLGFDKYRPLTSVVVAFMATLLVNPQINARYLTCLIPLLILQVVVMRKRSPTVGRVAPPLHANRPARGLLRV